MSQLNKRDWEKEYWEMFQAAAKSHSAYEKILAEKNAEIEKLERIKSAAQFVVDNRHNFEEHDVDGIKKAALNKLAILIAIMDLES